MKVNIDRKVLLKALNHVQSIVERRNTIPVLSNILINADNGQLVLTATDLEIEMRERVEAEVHQSGQITAPAHMLYDIVRNLPDDAHIELSIENETHLRLVSGTANFDLQTLPADDFPVMASDDMPVAFALPAADMQRLIGKTRFAISSEETRYYLNGIYLHVVDDTDAPSLCAVATDGHRLARLHMPRPVGADAMPAIIIPRKTVTEIHKLAEDDQGDIAIQVSQSCIKFAFADIVLTSKLIDGKFPDYGRVIPDDNDKSLTVTKNEFAQKINGVSTVSGEKSRAVKLTLNDNHLALSVSNPDSGQATDELNIAYDRDAMDIGFNAGYLIDVLQQIDGEQAIFELSDSGSPTIIRDSDDANVLYVLMPMRV